MWQAIIRAYRNAWCFASAFPLVVAAVVAFEGIQHLIEWWIGFYDSRAAAEALQHHPARLIAGIAKVGMLLALGYWLPRWTIGDKSARQTFAADPLALRRYAGVAAFTLMLTLVTQGLPAALADASGAAKSIGLGAMLLLSFVLNVALMPWMVGAALGDTHASPRRSLARIRGTFLWSLLFTLTVGLPLMLAHAVLAGLAIGRSPSVAAGMLVSDAILVGFLGVLLIAARVIVAGRAAARHGDVLPPPLTRCERIDRAAGIQAA
jgi:hypothetical protein